MLVLSSWQVQSTKQTNLTAAIRVTVHDYQANNGPADYIRLVRHKPVDAIEIKCEEEHVHRIMHEHQAKGCAKDAFHDLSSQSSKYLTNCDFEKFDYEEEENDRFIQWSKRKYGKKK